jgi:tetratricopeptide (TPR) repeat protein
VQFVTWLASPYWPKLRTSNQKFEQMAEASKHIFFKHSLDLMRLIYAVFVLFLTLMTSVQCQQTAEDPKNITTWFEKARNLLDMGENANATKVYDEANRIFQPNATIWIKEGSVISGSCEESIRCFDRAIKIYEESPNNATAWNNKGVALIYQAEEDRVGSRYSENMAHSRYRTDKFEQALECFEKATQLDPTSPFAWINKGYALWRTGTSNEPIEYYKTIEECCEKGEKLYGELKTGKGCMLLDNGMAHSGATAKYYEMLTTPHDVDRVARYA